MAGNIIHAIATTNAIVSGLIVAEALKLLAGAPAACQTSFLHQQVGGCLGAALMWHFCCWRLEGWSHAAAAGAGAALLADPQFILGAPPCLPASLPSCLLSATDAAAAERQSSSSPHPLAAASRGVSRLC
jgi:uncharacterized membrane protein